MNENEAQYYLKHEYGKSKEDTKSLNVVSALPCFPNVLNSVCTLKLFLRKKTYGHSLPHIHWIRVYHVSNSMEEVEPQHKKCNSIN